MNYIILHSWLYFSLDVTTSCVMREPLSREPHTKQEKKLSGNSTYCAHFATKMQKSVNSNPTLCMSVWLSHLPLPIMSLWTLWSGVETGWNTGLDYWIAHAQNNGWGVWSWLLPVDNETWSVGVEVRWLPYGRSHQHSSATSLNGFWTLIIVFWLPGVYSLTLFPPEWTACCSAYAN